VLVITPRVIASCFALIAFAGSLIAGIAAGNPLLTILVRATLIALGCYVVGVIIGLIANRSIEREVEKYQADRPLPGDDRSEPNEESLASQKRSRAGERQQPAAA
jgi:hypothetical protein